MTARAAIETLPLTPEDLSALPPGLLDRLPGGDGQRAGAALLIRAASARDAALVEKAVRLISTLAAEERAERAEASIASMVDFFLAGEPRARIDEALLLDNARLRADYLRRTPTLTAEEVHAQSGLTTRNRSEPASRWKREGRIFALPYRGADLFPAFQFADGAPHPALRPTLAALPRDLTPWQVAFWFASANGWLDGRAPADCLAEPEALAAAAARMAEPAVG